MLAGVAAKRQASCQLWIGAGGGGSGLSRPSRVYRAIILSLLSPITSSFLSGGLSATMVTTPSIATTGRTATLGATVLQTYQLRVNCAIRPVNCRQKYMNCMNCNNSKNLNYRFFELLQFTQFIYF